MLTGRCPTSILDEFGLELSCVTAGIVVQFKYSSAGEFHFSFRFRKLLLKSHKHHNYSHCLLLAFTDDCNVCPIFKLIFHYGRPYDSKDRPFCFTAVV